MVSKLRIIWKLTVHTNDATAGVEGAKGGVRAVASAAAAGATAAGSNSQTADIGFDEATDFEATAAPAGYGAIVLQGATGLYSLPAAFTALSTAIDETAFALVYWNGKDDHATGEHLPHRYLVRHGHTADQGRAGRSRAGRRQ